MATKFGPGFKVHELKASFRPRIRHVHLPDYPPLYAPRSLPGRIRDFLQSQIIGQRSIVEADAAEEPNEAIGSSVASTRSWLRQASPPPTILSFTRRPTYVLPKHLMSGREAWELDYVTANLKTRLDVVFPKPPNWSPSSFKSISEDEKDEVDMRHNPLTHKWEPGVTILPCAEPMYFGPGQLTIWPVMDLLDSLQRGKHFSTKYEYERILEETTIQVLRREYGLDAFSIPGKPGVWVESLIPPPELSDVNARGMDSAHQEMPEKRQNTRRIATVHADFVDNITRHGVSIHVGQPGPDTDRFGDLQINPWAAIRQDKITTSVVSELAMQGSVPTRSGLEQQNIAHRSDKKSLYLQTAFDEESPYIHKPLKAMPYSLVSLEPGMRQPVPLGLDNRDLSTAWAHEFARQLGLFNGIVDHFSNIHFPVAATNIPTKSRDIGFMSRPVMGEDQLKTPYEQVRVPSIKLKVGGLVDKDILESTKRIEINDERIPVDASPESWAMSWPLYYHNVTKLFAESIGGRPRDTRLTQVIRNQEVEARIERRWQAIQESDVLRDAWRIYQTPRDRKPRSFEEAIAADIINTTRDMQVILSSLEAGRINVPKRRLLWKTEHLRKLVETQSNHGSRDSDKPADTSSEATHMVPQIEGLDGVLQAAEKVLEQAKAWTSSSKHKPSQTVQQEWGSTEGSSNETRKAGLPDSIHGLPQQAKDSKPLFRPSSPARFVKLLPTRAERRRAARMDKRMQAVKAAKLGPPKPKPLYQHLPTKKEIRDQGKSSARPKSSE